MIDTHCHLIPGVDDGPAEQTEALELAQVLIADGVSEVICTPHYSRLFTYPHEVAADRLASLGGGPGPRRLATRADPCG